MKSLIALLLTAVSASAFAVPSGSLHRVTEEDCYRSQEIIQGAIDVRDEVDFDTVTRTLHGDRFKEINGFTAMLPMTEDYLKLVFFSGAVDSDPFLNQCFGMIGKSLAHSS